MPHDVVTTTSSQPGALDDVVLNLVDVQMAYSSGSGARQTEVLAVEDATLQAKRGEFLSLVGPSGCGKSTLLTAIAGLNAATNGIVEVNGQPVKGVRRDVGFIFQRDALLPWRSVLQNVRLPLRFRGVDKYEADERAHSWLSRMGLARFAGRYPHQLSGGQRKRVAIAATMVYEPDLLLMDEPFSALDVQTREIIENDIMEVWQQSQRQTVVFVTHDLEEAIGLSDRVIVMTAGPGRILSEYAVSLPRPRNILEIKFTDAFTRIHKLIWEDLRQEVALANESSAR